MIYERAYNLAKEVEDMFNKNLELKNQIDELNKEIAIKNKALELACEELDKYTGYKKQIAIEYFTQGAEQKLADLLKGEK